MTDLSEIIKTSVTETMTADALRAKVDKSVEELVNETIRDQLRSYGDIGKLIKEKVTESLQVPDLNLPSYSQMIMQMLRTQVEQAVQPILQERIAEDMQEILGLAPKTIKLSKIVEEMLTSSDAYQDGEHGDLVTCIVGDNSYGSTWVYLDDQGHYDESEKYRCSASMLVSSDGTIHCASYNGRDLGGKSKQGGMSVGRTYGLGDKLQAYYACKTIIEIDADNISTYRDYD